MNLQISSVVLLFRRASLTCLWSAVGWQTRPADFEFVLSRVLDSLGCRLIWSNPPFLCMSCIPFPPSQSSLGVFSCWSLGCKNGRLGVFSRWKQKSKGRGTVSTQGLWRSRFWTGIPSVMPLSLAYNESHGQLRFKTGETDYLLVEGVAKSYYKMV